MPSRQSIRLQIDLHGPFDLRWSDGADLLPTGRKQKALIALLAASPGLSRSRAWLQACLWERSGPGHGRASLRQALLSLRASLKDRAEHVLRIDNDTVALRPEAVSVHASPADGAFLEGIDLSEPGFEDWLREERQARQPADEVRAGHGGLRPRIAVLPFLCMPVREHPDILGDALAQEVLRVMSRSQLVEVLSHLSSRATLSAGRPLEAFRDRLGCDYLVTGTCRQDGDRLILDIDVHDAAGYSLVGNNRRTGSMAAFFAGEDAEIAALAGDILNAVFVSEIRLGAMRPLPQLATHNLLMSAIGMMFRMTPAEFERAGRHLGQVTDRAAGHSAGWAWRAQWHLLRIFQGHGSDPGHDRAEAIAMLARAREADPHCSLALAIDGNVRTTLLGDFDAARRSFDEALEINPSSVSACQMKAVLHAFLGEGAQAVALTRRARMLSPLDPREPFFDALGAAAYLVAEDYETAIAMAERAIRAQTGHVSAHRARVVALELAGRHAEAAGAARALRQVDPGITVSGYLATHPAAELPTGRTWAGALASAGIPVN